MNNDLGDAGAGPNIIIKEADETQILDIVSLGEKIFKNSWDEQMVATSFYNTYDNVLSAVDVDNGESLVGYCIFSCPNEDCELLRIAVTKKYRYKKIATRLMERMIEMCAEEGCENIFLEVRESNKGAIALYEHFGFEEISKRKRYYHDPEEDALIMKLENVTGIK